MINLYSTKRVTSKTINLFSKFVLIGNNIDGFVDVGIQEFENFEDLKFRLPNIIENIGFAGEWDLKLYQIPDQLKIKRLYGYYKVPLRGRLIFELSYMNADKNIEVFITEGMIHIYTYSELNFDEKDQDTGVIITGSDLKDFITVLLYTKNSKNKRYVNDDLVIENDHYFRYKNSCGLTEISNFSFD
jgi:hypothetical protein